MVFVWSNLVDGEPHFTLSQVALNDLIMVVAFAPIVGLLLGLSAIIVPWATLLLSVVLYIVVPVVVAQAWRGMLLRRGGRGALSATLARLAPLSLGALLLTLVILFGLQGEQIIAQPLVIALLAVPILIQVYLNAGLAYWLNRRLGVAWCVAGPSALIGASNFFELAVATAIALFGFQSGAALATVVGVLVEVPVMLSVVAIVRRSRGWYEAATAVAVQRGGSGVPARIFQNCSVELTRGKGPSGTGTSRKRQSGSQPSAASKTSRRAGGISAFTSATRRRSAAMAAPRSVARPPKVCSRMMRWLASRMARRCGGRSGSRGIVSEVAMVSEKLLHHASSSRTDSTTFASG